MEQTQEKKVVGERIVSQMLNKDQAEAGVICFNTLMPENQPVKIVSINNTSVKVTVWNEYKSKMIQTVVSLYDLYIKVRVPVYEE
jgi:hypothetical protein